MNDVPLCLEYDWYGRGLPPNVRIGRDVYIDSAYGFAPFRSERSPGLVLGDACGAYDRATFVVGPGGAVTVGDYTCLNGTYIVANERVTIGAHCLLAWGSVVADSWIGAPASQEARRALLRAAAGDPGRHPGAPGPPRPVTLGDNVWIGFDSVVLPGVTIGRGAIVGCKTVVAEDVEPYAVVVGDPPRVVRRLDADDSREARERALRECSR